jgi:hypothetical protein
MNLCTYQNHIHAISSTNTNGHVNTTTTTTTHHSKNTAPGTDVNHHHPPQQQHCYEYRGQPPPPTTATTLLRAQRHVDVPSNTRRRTSALTSRARPNMTDKLARVKNKADNVALRTSLRFAIFNTHTHTHTGQISRAHHTTVVFFPTHHNTYFFPLMHTQIKNKQWGGVRTWTSLAQGLGGAFQSHLVLLATVSAPKQPARTIVRVCVCVCVCVCVFDITPSTQKFIKMMNRTMPKKQRNRKG